MRSRVQGYKDAHLFDPDRFGPERKEDVSCARNFMTFGFGPHYCVGKEYATNHLIVYLAVLATRWTPSSAQRWTLLTPLGVDISDGCCAGQ